MVAIEAHQRNMVSDDLTTLLSFPHVFHLASRSSKGAQGS